MTEYVGKIIPGICAVFLGIYGLATIPENVLGTTNAILLGFMTLWGVSMSYAEVLNAIDDIHRYAAKQIGVTA